MKKLLLIFFLTGFPLLYCLAQDQPPSANNKSHTQEMTLRPNSRDYNIVRKGNNHQRLVQIRRIAMMRNRQAIMNRTMAMEKRRLIIQQQMMRQQGMRQRMIRQKRINH